MNTPEPQPYYQFPDAPTHWLPRHELQDGALYVIDARNAFLGIWQRAESGFLIARPLFNPQRLNGRMRWIPAGHQLATEYHWDEDSMVATARPRRFVEHVPGKDWDNLLGYLRRREEEFARQTAYALLAPAALP
jgi:hypothetical protein